MTRFAFLDWARGLAVVIMIECHVFNSFTRMDLREGGPYVISQFVGGMAAVLFLFMAGMTLGFQMESLDRRAPTLWTRWVGALRRGGYVLGVAFAFRITNWIAAWPHAQPGEVLKVDILNCMGVAMIALSALVIVTPRLRPHAAVVSALAIASVAPLVDAWILLDGAPALLRAYVVPKGGRFPFFPWAAYVGFGIAAGCTLKRTTTDRVERMLQWWVLIGFALVFGAQYFSNVPYSLYDKTEFWIDSPALVLIRAGLCLIALAASYVWTEHCAGPGWSWMQALGKTSLLVYWIHVMMVYGDIVKPLKRSFSIVGSTLALVVVTALMVALAAARLKYSERKAARAHALARAR